LKRVCDAIYSRAKASALREPLHVAAVAARDIKHV
jgi:hypothetical protein